MLIWLTLLRNTTMWSQLTSTHLVLLAMNCSLVHIMRHHLLLVNSSISLQKWHLLVLCWHSWCQITQWRCGDLCWDLCSSVADCRDFCAWNWLWQLWSNGVSSGTHVDPAHVTRTSQIWGQMNSKVHFNFIWFKLMNSERKRINAISNQHDSYSRNRKRRQQWRTAATRSTRMGWREPSWSHRTSGLLAWCNRRIPLLCLIGNIQLWAENLAIYTQLVNTTNHVDDACCLSTDETVMSSLIVYHKLVKLLGVISIIISFHTTIAASEKSDTITDDSIADNIKAPTTWWRTMNVQQRQVAEAGEATGKPLPPPLLPPPTTTVGTVGVIRSPHLCLNGCIYRPKILV